MNMHKRRVTVVSCILWLSYTKEAIATFHYYCNRSNIRERERERERDRQTETERDIERQR